MSISIAAVAAVPTHGSGSTNTTSTAIGRCVRPGGLSRTANTSISAYTPRSTSTAGTARRCRTIATCAQGRPTGTASTASTYQTRSASAARSGKSRVGHAEGVRVAAGTASAAVDATSTASAAPPP